MAKGTQDLPNLANATAGGIVDMCAPEQAELNRLELRTKFMKKALLSRLEPEHVISELESIVKGEIYLASIIRSFPNRINLEAIASSLLALGAKYNIPELKDGEAVGLFVVDNFYAQGDQQSTRFSKLEVVQASAEAKLATLSPKEQVALGLQSTTPASTGKR